MLVELSVVPVGEGLHMTEPVSVAVELIAQSGLDYQVTAMGTLIEGPDEAVWALVRRCHEAVRRASGRVITELRIDDAKQAGHDLSASVRRVEERLAHDLSKAS